MTDKELLELAAKAAGIKIIRITDTGMPLIHGKDENGKHWDSWNPLTDDGDALRLAVKLRMMVDVGGGGLCTADIEALESSVNEIATPDPYAATRRAIVRAAAAIGETL